MKVAIEPRIISTSAVLMHEVTNCVLKNPADFDLLAIIYGKRE
jgi:hypothetical protein